MEGIYPKLPRVKSLSFSKAIIVALILVVFVLGIEGILYLKINRNVVGNQAAENTFPTSTSHPAPDTESGVKINGKITKIVNGVLFVQPEGKLTPEEIVLKNRIIVWLPKKATELRVSSPMDLVGKEDIELISEKDGQITIFY